MLTEQYRQSYNRIRPHSSLGFRPLTSETVLPQDPVLSLASLTQRVVRIMEASHTSNAKARLAIMMPLMGTPARIVD